jgi:outer membrane protein OmpA-like peptidoglycan-associated protein
MSRHTLLDPAGEKAAASEPWRRWVIAALVLSLAAHAALIWWSAGYQVNIFSDSYYDRIVPRAFKVDRVEIDARLLDDGTSPAEETVRKITPAPVELPEEDIAAEKTEVRAAPVKPGQLSIGAEPVPAVGTASGDAAARLAAAGASALADDLAAMTEALLAEQAASSAQPAIELARAAGQPGAEGEKTLPAGYSDLDDLLAQTGGVATSAGPIFMPSDVLFGYDESFLRPEAITSLEKLGELIRRNPQARFRIEGHTDSFGGAEYNAKLSLARAESVKQWLVDIMSIDPGRIDTLGLGNNKPLAPVDGTVGEQQLNRRVEIVILRAAAER